MTKTLDQRLRIRGDVGVFDEAEVAGSDEPVRRYFRAAVAPGTHLAQEALSRARRDGVGRGLPLVEPPTAEMA
jgi:hypothetical protein